MILQNYGKSMQQFGFYSSLAQRLNICIRTKNRENLQKDINISSRGVYPPFNYKMFMINTNTFPHIFWIQKVINISSGVVYPPIHHKVFMINNNTFPPIFFILQAPCWTDLHNSIWVHCINVKNHVIKQINHYVQIHLITVQIEIKNH